MTSTFIAKITDINHRLYISKEVWHIEDLQIGEYVKVTIEKVKVEK
jgi:hypothetical protein